MISRLHTAAALAAALLVAAPAFAGPDYSASKKAQYPSPNLNRADADSLVLRGTGSTGEIPNMTVSGRRLGDVIKGDGSITAGVNVATTALLSPEDPAPIIDLRSKRVWGFSGFSNTGQFSMCTWLGCDDKRDIQVVRALLQGRTTRGELNAESNLALDYFINTGFVPNWKPSTVVAAGSYATNRYTTNGTGYNSLYQALTGGTTAASGGPTGQGASIADGSVVWKYVQPGDDTNNKTNFAITTYAGPNAANSWGIASNVYIAPDFRAQTVIGHENDMHNDGPDCTSNLRNCYLHLGYVNGPGTITAFSSLSAAGGVTPVSADNLSGGAAFNGVVIDGVNAIRNYAFIDGSNSKAGFKCDAGTRKNEACFFDFSNGATGQLIKGTKAYAGIVEGSTAPLALSLEGNYSSAALKYKNALLGDWTADKTYTALTFSQSFDNGALMGLFGKAGDNTLYVSTPLTVETRSANTTVSLLSNSQAKFFVPITSTSLAGADTRYACVNPSGTIFASTTICR